MDAQDFRSLQEAYVEVYQLDELYKGRHGQSDAEYQAGRSDAGKRISGDDKTGPRYYTLGRSRGATPDAPTAPGARPVNTPKLSASEKEYHQYNKSAAKNRAKYNKVGGTKGLPEEVDIYDIILSHLLDEGYAETPEAAEAIMVSMSEEWREGIVEERKPLPVGKMDAKSKELKSKFLKSKPGSSEAKNLISRASQITGTRDKQTEQVDIYDIILSHLLDEGYAETPEAAEVIMVSMSEEWRQSICEGNVSKKQQQKDAKTREKWYGEKAVKSGTDRFSQLQKKAIKSGETKLF